MYASPVSAKSEQQGLLFSQPNSASSTSTSQGGIGGSGVAALSSFNASSGGGGDGYGRFGLGWIIRIVSSSIAMLRRVEEAVGTGDLGWVG
jgi:hypothetical protein